MRKIKLTKDKYALIDNEDYLELNQWKWSYLNGGYAVRIKKEKMIYMHRVIMNPPKNMDIDHKNGNKLDNRKSNLRIATRSQNFANKMSKNRWGFKGVKKDNNKKERQFMARITCNYKEICLGYYLTPQEAAIAYNNAAVKYFGEFARLNKIND